MTSCPPGIECYAHLRYNATQAKPNGPYGHDLIHLHLPEVTIGREKCTVLLDSEDLPTTLSRKHALITRDASGHVFLKDTSTNGTKINTDKISRPTQLKHGDVITFGVSDVVYIFEQVSFPPNQTQSANPPASTPNKPNIKPENNIMNSNTVTPNNVNNNHFNTIKMNNDDIKQLNTSGDHKHKLEDDEEDLKFNITFPTKPAKKLKHEDEGTLVEMHQQIYKIGEQVEAKCQKTSAPECNAWFEATVIHFNPENGLYTIKFEGYTDYYNESLPLACLRCPSNGDWNYKDVKEGDNVIVGYRGWWYDATVMKKLGFVSKKSKKACLQVSLVDVPGVELKCEYEEVYLPVYKT